MGDGDAGLKSVDANRVRDDREDGDGDGVVRSPKRVGRVGDDQRGGRGGGWPGVDG